MSTNEQARERLAQQRQHEEHVQETMRERSEESIRADNTDAQTEEKAREHLTQERHHEEHVQQTMLNRSEAELQDKGTD